MLAVIFSLTACSDGQEHVEFNYTETDIIYSSVMLTYNLQYMGDADRAYIQAEGGEVYQTGLSNMDILKEECGDFNGYVSRENGSSIQIDFQNIDTSSEEGFAELTDFLSQVDAKVEENGADVTVTLNMAYEKRNAEVSIVFEEDTAYAYGGSSAPYKPKEITAAPDYTMGEKMAKAGANTLMGMGTVFIVLIFISLIIAQFEKLDKAIVKVSNKFSRRKDKKKEEGKPVPHKAVSVPAAPIPVNPSSVNLMDDTQLVAVITAAVTAANSASGGSDRLVVRSIRKAKR